MNVSMSVGKRVVCKTAHRIFLKLLTELGCLNGKKLTAGLLGKNLIMGIMPQNTLKIGVFLFFWLCKKKVHWCVDFFGYTTCIIMAHMILLKLHLWEKSGSWVKYKNTLSRSDGRIFLNFNISKTIARVKLIFWMQV